MAILIGDINPNSLSTTISAAFNYGIEADLVVGLGGIDTIHTGANNDIIDAGDGGDFVSDGDGDDYVILGAGDDFLQADAGNDVYYGGSGTDTASFILIHLGPTFASDVPSTGVTFDLASTAFQNLGEFGFDRFFGFENALGTPQADRFFGTAGANQLDGAAGNDLLIGRGGADTFGPGEGADTMRGDAGADDIFCSEAIAARDRVAYTLLSDSGTTFPTLDEIFGFDRGGTATDDKIDLSAIDANPLVAGNQAFLFRGAGAFTAVRGEVRTQTVGADTLVHVDTDVDAASEMTIRVVGVTGLTGRGFHSLGVLPRAGAGILRESEDDDPGRDR